MFDGTRGTRRLIIARGFNSGGGQGYIGHEERVGRGRGEKRGEDVVAVVDGCSEGGSNEYGEDCGRWK